MEDELTASPTVGGMQSTKDTRVSTAKHVKESTDSSGLSGETAGGDDADVLFNRVHMAKTQLLPSLSAPGEDEQAQYYHGIASRPRLVGRASAGVEPWISIETQYKIWEQQPVYQPWFEPTKKCLSNIGAHHIRNVWENIHPSIVLAISRLPWTSVDVLRICAVQGPVVHKPVVVWIGVEHDDIPWRLVAEALRACRMILDEKDLSDVDVQIRVSHVFPLTSRPALVPMSPSPRGGAREIAQRPFKAAIGQSISPVSLPSVFGTLGAFISPSTAAAADKEGGETDPAPVWAVTCRHVGLAHDTKGENDPYLPPAGEADPLHHFCMPSDHIAAREIRAAKNKRAAWDRAASQSGRDEDKAMFDEADKTYSTLLAFESTDARICGAVHFAPPIGKERTAYPPRWTEASPLIWAKDYCVLSMDAAKFPIAESITNVVDMRSLNADGDLSTSITNAQRLNQQDFLFPANDFVRVKGLVPLAEMCSPPDKYENPMDNNCMIVMKQGASSGLTFGCPSELLSVVRVQMPGGDTVATLEWAIPGSFENRHTAFSRGGDSGAAVVSLDGRLGGFITRGAGAGTREGFSVDVTYATPAVLVLADIEKELGCSVVLR